MTAKRKICVVTGTRAEYGLLQWLMRDIAADPALCLQLVVTGAHLSPEFGSTYRQIEADGFVIDAKVEMLSASDTPTGITKSMGRGVMGFADALSQLQPDVLVVLGDRFEILAVAQAALIARVPIAHIHGGELTEGAFDDAIRHAITKMAHWHFVAADAYRKRVVQLGESPDRVFNFGAPGLDHMQRLEWLTRGALEQTLDITLGTPTFLVTYHPATLGTLTPEAAMSELLAALDDFPNATVIFTYPNADTGGRGLIAQIDRWTAANRNRAKAFVSLGQQRYLSLMREADVIVGNSSSALIEAPALKKAVVNVGDRQKGRLQATSIIDAAEEKNAITGAIRQALSDVFRSRLPSTQSLYGSGDVSRRIKDALKTVALDSRKTFFDIDHKY